MPSGWRPTSTGLFFLILLCDPTKIWALLAPKREVVVLSSLCHSSSSSLKITSSTELGVSSAMFPEEVPVQIIQPKPVMEPPLTETLFERPKTPPKSYSPKIVVLGSTGRIGRRVIRQLMALESDITVVAFVRNYERACEVLYDELLMERNEKGPKLQLVVTDLVPKSLVAGYISPSDEDDEDDKEYAVSASRFYKNGMKDYDFQSSKEDDASDLNPYLQLKDAITNATAIISTIGTVRSTIPFADYLFQPWRIFMSVGNWCTDSTHPYYVNYMVHKKVLEYCEEAQRSRNRERRVWQNTERRRGAKNAIHDQNGGETGSYIEGVKKIRIVRISDHCLANPAWDIVNVMTNIVRSMVFRYQEKCEKLLSSSNLVDSFILRPGDLVDDQRNDTTTTMSVDVDGKLPGPLMVGRDDVATLATLAAISNLDPPVKKTKEVFSTDKKMCSTQLQNDHQRTRQKMGDSKPRHWNIAVGWQQGTGYSNADQCMKYIVKEHGKRRKSKRRKQKILNASPVSRMLLQPYQSAMLNARQRTIKPYRLFAFLPMFLLVYPTILSILVTVGKQIPAVKSSALYILTMIEPMREIMLERSQGIVKKLVFRSGMKGKGAGLLID